MSEVYIGARESRSIAKTIGRSPSYLNQGMAELLRSACLSLGIKKTEQRQKLNFYVVSADEYEKLTDEHQRVMNKLSGHTNVHHLVKIDADQLGEVIRKVNDKYGGPRMDPKKYTTYKLKMNQALQKIVEITGKDKNTRVEAAKKPDNPYKAGDILKLQQYRLMSIPGQDKNNPIQYANTRISWAGKRMVEIERLVPRCDGNFWPNTQSAMTYFNNVIAWGIPSDGRPMYAGDPHGHFVPLLGNEDKLEWRTVMRHCWKTDRDLPARQEWTRYADHIYQGPAGHSPYSSRRADQPVLGYYYDYSGSRD